MNTHPLFSTCSHVFVPSLPPNSTWCCCCNFASMRRTGRGARTPIRLSQPLVALSVRFTRVRVRFCAWVRLPARPSFDFGADSPKTFLFFSFFFHSGHCELSGAESRTIDAVDGPPAPDTVQACQRPALFLLCFCAFRTTLTQTYHSVMGTSFCFRSVGRASALRFGLPS